MTVAADKDITGPKARFVRSLIGKADETRALSAEVQRGNDDGALLHVHLEALHAAARIFELDTLADALILQIDAFDPEGDTPLVAWLTDVEALSWKYLSLSQGATGTDTDPTTDPSDVEVRRSVSDNGYREWTLRTMVDRVVDEIQTGLLTDAVGDLDAPLGKQDEADVLAATWSTISRLRALVQELSEDRLSFEDSLGVAMVTVTGAPAPDAEAPLADVDLRDCTALVADDDPTIRWFYAGLLREAGATVVEVQDGRSAIDEARRVMPDLVLADILMPNLDGIGVARALKREPFLGNVPLILLSWREDFLQRVRGLDTGAKGFLRKEAPRDQVLERVASLLQPLEHFKRGLRSAGELRAELRGLSILQALKLIGTHRGTAKVLLQDTWSIFDVVVVDGELADVRCTGVDGNRCVGREALRRLASVRDGRLVVTDAPTAVDDRGPDLRPLLLEEAGRLSAMAECITDGQTVKLSLDPDRVTTYLRHAIEPSSAIAKQLAVGYTIDEISQTRARDAVLGVALELLNLGAVHSVETFDGRDLVQPVIDARRQVQVPSDASTSNGAVSLTWAPESDAFDSAPPTDAPAETERRDPEPVVVARVVPVPRAEHDAPRENARAESMMAMRRAAANEAPLEPVGHNSRVNDVVC